MTKVLCIQGMNVSATNVTTANTTQYWSVGCVGALEVPTTTEANVSVLQKNAGTFTNLTIGIITNTIAGSTTFTFRNNATDGNMVVSVPSNATGNFRETTPSSDTVVSGDKTSVKSIPGAATGTCDVLDMSTIFLNTSSADTITRLALNDPGNPISSASATIYEPIAGEDSTTKQTTEAPVKCRIRKDGTLQKAGLYILSNARTTNTVFTLRKNAADTNIVITVGNQATGWIEQDTPANTVSVVAGDDVDWKIVTGTGTQSLTCQALCIDYVNTSGWFPLVIANGDAPGIGDNTTGYNPLAGLWNFNGPLAAEASADSYASAPFIFAELTTLVTQNDVGSAASVTLMKNAVATTLVCSITGNTSQLFADSTHTVIAGSGDLLDYKVVVPSVSGSHTVTIKNVIMWGREIAPLYLHAANSTVSGTLPTTVQAALGAPTQSVDAATVNRSMDVTRGTSQTSLAMGSTPNNTRQYFSRFCSLPLGQTSIAANTWYFSFAAAENGLSGNFPVNGTAQVLNVTLYVWRPSTGAKIATIKDGNADATFNEPTVINTETSVSGTFAGSAAASIAVGDILCLEVYFAISPSQPSANTFYYDGTDEVTSNGKTVSSHASFIATPETLLFSTLTRVTLGNTLLYNIIQRQTHSNILKYNVAKQVLHSNTLLYNLRKQVLHSNSLKYNLLKQILKPNILKYNLIGRVVHSQTLKYHLLKQILHANTLRYKIWLQVQHANTIKYNLWKQVTKSNSLLWNIVGTLYRITQQNSLLYNLIQRQTHANTLKNNILNSVAKANTLKYNLWRQITHSNTLKYNVLKQVLNSNTIKYNLLKQITHANTLRYKLAQQITKSSIIKYNIIGRIIHSNTLKYNVLRQITKQNILKYNLIGRIVHANILKYNVLQQALHSNTIKYNLLKQALQSSTVKYNLLEQITKAETLLWNIEGQLARITHANILKYNIIQRQIHANTIKYHIAQQATKANTLKYSIWQQITKSNILKYHLLQQIAQPNTLKYNLRQQITKQNSLLYNLRLQVTKANTIKYSLQQLVAKANTLRYNIIQATRTYDAQSTSLHVGSLSTTNLDYEVEP